MEHTEKSKFGFYLHYLSFLFSNHHGLSIYCKPIFQLINNMIQTFHHNSLKNKNKRSQVIYKSQIYNFEFNINVNYELSTCIKGEEYSELSTLENYELCISQDKKVGIQHDQQTYLFDCSSGLFCSGLCSPNRQ